MSLTRRVLSNTAMQIVARTVASAISFAIFVLVNRHLSAEAFGRYAYYLTAFGLASHFINFGCDGIALREIARGRGDERRIVGGIVRFKSLTALIVIVIIGMLTLVYEETVQSRWLVVLASTHLLGYALAAPAVSFQARLRFRLPATARIAGAMLFLIAGLACFAGGCRRSEIYLILFGAGYLLHASIIFVAARSLIRLSFDQRREEFLIFFREMAPIGVAAIAHSLYMFMDTLFLRQMLGEAAVGRYNAAYQLLVFSLMVPIFFSQVLFPVLSRYHEQQRELFAVILRRALLYLLLLGLPLALALQFVAEPIVQGLYRNPAAETVQVLRVLGWAMLLAFVSYPFITALTAIRRQCEFMWIALLAAALNFVLNLIWIPRFGISGAAWATVVTEVVVLTLAAAALTRATSIRPTGVELWKVPVIGAVIGLLAWVIRDWSLVPVLVAVPAGIMASLYLLRCLPFDLLRGAEPTERVVADSFGDHLDCSDLAPPDHGN